MKIYSLYIVYIYSLCLFYWLYKLSLSLINFLFETVLPFELHFIYIKLFFTHSRQIGEYLTGEFWDMDLFCGPGRARVMINCNFWNTGILVENVTIKTNKDVFRRKDLFIFIPNRFEVIFWEFLCMIASCFSKLAKC